MNLKKLNELRSGIFELLLSRYIDKRLYMDTDLSNYFLHLFIV